MLKVEDRIGFREMFRMNIAYFEIILSKILDLITPKDKIGGTNPLYTDERPALTNRFLATGETYKSLLSI